MTLETMAPPRDDPLVSLPVAATRPISNRRKSGRAHRQLHYQLGRDQRKNSEAIKCLLQKHYQQAGKMKSISLKASALKHIVIVSGAATAHGACSGYRRNWQRFESVVRSR